MKKKINNIKKERKQKITIKNKYLISIVIITILFIGMLIIFYQNITLKIKRKELNNYLEEYTELKEEIDYLNQIKENYEIIKKNNEELLSEKKDLEDKISELNNQINRVCKKICVNDIYP